MSDKEPEKQYKELDLADLPELVSTDNVEEIINDETKSPEEKSQLIKQIISVRESFSGPLPPPQILARYNEVVSNGSERIFRNFEEQSSHRRSIEKSVIEGQLEESKRGQWFAFFITIIVLSVTAYLAINEKTAVACVLGGTTIVGLAGAFIAGKYLQKKDLESKG